MDESAELDVDDVRVAAVVEEFLDSNSDKLEEKREKDTLMAMADDYQHHCEKHPGTLIQYLGCHSMGLRWQFADKIYFVVMRNFFPVRPQLSFDLKGATANRRALKTWELHQANTVAGLYSTL